MKVNWYKVGLIVFIAIVIFAAGFIAHKPETITTYIGVTDVQVKEMRDSFDNVTILFEDTIKGLASQNEFSNYKIKLLENTLPHYSNDQLTDSINFYFGANGEGLPTHL